MQKQRDRSQGSTRPVAVFPRVENSGSSLLRFANPEEHDLKA